MKTTVLFLYSLWATPLAIFYGLSVLGEVNGMSIGMSSFSLIWFISILFLWRGSFCAWIFNLCVCMLAFGMGSYLLIPSWQAFNGTYTGRPEFLGISFFLFLLFGLPAFIYLGLLFFYRKSILTPNDRVQKLDTH